jgi:D-lactate dehydrogenase (quinone)
VPIDPGALARLRGALAGSVDSDPEPLRSVSTDASGVVGAAEARAFPEGVPDVVALVRWAGATGIPLVARGGGTSLDGESVPTRGGVVVDFSRWDRVLEIDPVDGIARVQPGVLNRALDRALAPLGLTYPPNPGSGETCTLGGNVATNASGPRSFRHGPTRAWIRALNVVDGTGAAWTAGGRFAKSSVGPDLLSLLVGSEGTLALFTEISVRVALRPARRTGLVLAIPDRTPLGRFIAELKAVLGPSISAIEFADAGTALALARFAGPDWPSGRGVLMVELESSESEEGESLTRLQGARERLGLSEDPLVYADAERLWRIRGAAGPALQADGGPGLREDVAVPISQLDALLEAVHALAERSGTPVRVFGHVGEGNLHPVFSVDPPSPRAAGVRRALCDATLRLGGTISAEHGVGATKRDRLSDQLGAPAIAALWSLKRTLDPHGILNPGKLLMEPASESDGPLSGSPSAGAARRTPPE